jgi:hypothetical protein
MLQMKSNATANPHLGSLKQVFSRNVSAKYSDVAVKLPGVQAGLGEVPFVGGTYND